MAPPARSTGDTRRRGGTFRAFANSNYVRLWLANCLSYSARWMQMILLAWLILELTDSPWLVALVGFFSSAPMLLLGLAGGVLADVVDRQRLLLYTQGANVACNLLLTLLLITRAVEVWHAYLTALATGASWALSSPSRRVIFYDLLGTSGVTNAVALDSVGQNMSRMLGPALAGVLIALVDVGGGYVVITGFYGIGFGLLWSLQMPPLARVVRPRRPVVRNLIEGFGYVWQNQTILAIIWITVIMNMLLFSYMPMISVMARDVLHVGPTLMGALLAVEGLGALIGAMIIASAVGVRYHGRVFLAGSLLALLALLVFSMSRWYIVAVPTLFIMGLGSAGFGTMQSAIVMLVAKEDMRGRSLGVVSLAIGAGPLGSLLLGAVADAISPVFALRMNALLGIITLACITVVLPAIVDRTHRG